MTGRPPPAASDGAAPGSGPPPFPFVVGSGRSGTTLLRAMLDSHPQLAVPHESYFVETMARRRDGYLVGGRFDVDAFCRELARDVRFQRWELSMADVRAELSAADVDDLAAAIRAVYAAWARHEGKPRYADKTPSYALAVGRIADLLPESCFVHIVRDGRDVATSYRATGLRGGDVTALACRWRRHVGAARAAGARLGRDRYLEVRYEGLAADPAVVLHEVCAFVGLPWDDAMLEYRSRADRMVSRRTPAGVHDRLHRAPTKGLRDWRQEMPPEDQRRFEQVAGDLLEDLGYEVGGAPAPGPGGRIRTTAQDRLQRLEEAARRSRAANRLRHPYGRLREVVGRPA